MLQWISQHHDIEDWYRLTNFAAFRGSVEILEWLTNEQDVIVDAYDLQEAAQGGQVAAMEWLIEHGCQVTTEACEWAAYHGARQGNTATLEWLRSRGHLIVFEDLYLFVDKLREDENHSSYAHVWKWLREVAECPWNAQELALEAADANCSEALQYVHQYGGPFNADQLAAQLESACDAESYTTAELLLSQGAAWPDVVYEVSGDLPATVWDDSPNWTFLHDMITWAQAHGFTGTVTPYNPE